MTCKNGRLQTKDWRYAGENTSDTSYELMPCKLNAIIKFRAHQTFEI